MGKKNCNKNNDKKNNELNILKLAMAQGSISTQSDTRRICNSLKKSSIDFIESPDFLLTNDEEHICYGVEHLRVDHQIRKQHGKIGAASTRFWKDAEDIRQKYKDNIEGNEVNALNALSGNIEGQLERTFNATYNDLIKSFNYSIGKHIGKIDLYKTNCEEKIGHGYSYKLVLLIEVVTDFSRLYVCNYRGAKRNTDGLMPIFDDVISILSHKELDNVDYFVLVLKKYIGNDIKIVALDNECLAKSLAKNGIKPVKYLAFEKYLSEEKIKRVQLTINDASMKAEMLELPYEIKYKLWGKEEFMPAVFTAAKEAMYYKSMRKDFVTDYGTLFFIEVYGKNVKGWKKLSGSNLYIADPIEISESIRNKRIKKFDGKYPL